MAVGVRHQHALAGLEGHGGDALLLLGEFTLADVGQGDAAARCAGLFTGGRESAQQRPEPVTARPYHLQLDGTGLATVERPLAAEVIEILVLGGDELRQRALRQRHPWGSQQLGGGEVRLLDHPLVEDEITHRHQLEQLPIARQRGLNLLLRPAQLLVLHLQLDLIDTQLVEQLPAFPVSRRRRLEELFRPLAQVLTCFFGNGPVTGVAVSIYSIAHSPIPLALFLSSEF